MSTESHRQKTFENLGWGTLAAELAGRCHTSRGSERGRALDLLAEPPLAHARSADIAEARLLWALAEPMPFGDIHDLEPLLPRVEKGGDLEGPELLSVGRTVAGVARLRRHLAARAAQVPRLADRVAAILELSHVSGPILDCFEDSGQLADHASPALGNMRRRVRSLHEELGRRVKDLLDDPDIAPFLQDRFYTQREERYVVPLRAEARSKVRGIVHGTSQSGHTVFVEPEAVVDLNNRLKIAESEVADEERRILRELTGYVREELGAIAAGTAAACDLDFLDGAARLADALGASAPVVEEGGPLELMHARHPLMILAGRPCVANDIKLPASGTLVISGPNAGGKTVALKTAGLCALMARAGLHIPAEVGSRVPWYEIVDTDIGDDQSLERNLSTFSAHVMNIVEFLERAGPRTLLLIDELAVGTDPDQGAALAQSVLEALAERGTQVIVTTHYERLKAMPGSDPRFVNASVGFDLERMAPTFKLHLGAPGASGAFLVARRLGVPGAVLARAADLLGDRRAGIEEMLTGLTEERRRLDLQRAAAETARREAEAARHEAEARERAARVREAEARRGAHDEATAALRRARDALDSLRQRWKKAEADAPDLPAMKAELAAVAADVAARTPERALPGRPATEADLVAGARVVVAALGGRGVVVGPPERGRVTVQIGALKTTVAIDEVRLDDGKAPAAGKPGLSAVKRRPAPSPAPAAEPVVARADADEAGARTPDATLDLRGNRVDEALGEVDRFLDDALLASREVVFVIHGHGTGALREAVRDHVDMHAAVKRWRAGREKEGGDGVTVVWLDG